MGEGVITHEFYAPGDIIEGAKCDICTRKYDFKGLQKDPITNTPMVKYELSKNGSVEVTKEMTYSKEEREKRDSLNIHYKLADKIRAEAITVYINTLTKVDFKDTEGVSHTHGANIYSSKESVVGVIKYPFNNLSKALGEKSQKYIALKNGK
ncbi:MAG: hypothetical protein IK041_01245 [Bacteroidales bacterium]|nr:hypothetical protein [Bacteroidales bacterium]